MAGVNRAQAAAAALAHANAMDPNVFAAKNLQFLALRHPLEAARNVDEWSQRFTAHRQASHNARNWGGLLILRQLLTCVKMMWDATYSDPQWRLLPVGERRLGDEEEIFANLDIEMSGSIATATFSGWSYL